MEECAASSLLDRTHCILSYGGSEHDILINYGILVWNLAYCTYVTHCDSKTSQHRNSHSRTRLALSSLVFVSVFQIGLCLMVGCSGVSIIWCACGGWVVSRRTLSLSRVSSGNTDQVADETPTRQRQVFEGLLEFLWELSVMILDLCAVSYYYMVAEFISTVAHLCAILLGVILYFVCDRLVLKWHHIVPYTSQTSIGDHPVDRTPLLHQTS